MKHGKTIWRRMDEINVNHDDKANKHEKEHKSHKDNNTK